MQVVVTSGCRARTVGRGIMAVAEGDREQARRRVDGLRARMIATAKQALSSGRATMFDPTDLRAAGAAWFERSTTRAAPRELTGASHWPALADAYPYLDHVDTLAGGTTRVRVVLNRAEVEGHASGAAVPFLASCAVDYRLGYVPGDAWVVDRRSAVIGSPTTDDTSGGAIRTEDPELVHAVVEYVDAVTATAHRVGEFVRDLPCLTRRQHAVAAILLEVKNDEEAARAMGISTRTFRGEVDALYGLAGVSNRLALGLVYGRATLRGFGEGHRALAG